MKGSLLITDRPRQRKPRLRDMTTRHAWPIEIMEGRYKGRVYFIYSHHGRKYYRWLNTLTGDELDVLLHQCGNESGRYVEDGECIEITVKGKP